MARRPDPEPLPVVRVSVVPETTPRSPPRRALRPLALVLAVAALMAVVLAPILSRGGAARPRPAALVAPIPRGALFGDPNDPGIDAIAAAFRGPLRCQSLHPAPSDPAYVRAVPGAGRACASQRNIGAAVYHLVDREWQLVLYTIRYSCPVAGMPVAVQAQLRLCPRR